MKIIPVIVLVFFAASCLPGQNEPARPDTLHGYAEGRVLYIAPLVSERLHVVSVKEGDTVKKGDPLFRLDDETGRQNLAAAQGALDAASARLDDLLAGGRPEDIRAAQAALKSAQAAYDLARATQKRSAALVARGQAPQARLDTDTAKLKEAAAAVRTQKARLALIRLPARADAIRAARNDVQIRKANFLAVQKALHNYAVAAPASGRIEAVLRRPGELAGPGQPVLSLLPPDEIRIRFFVPQARLASLQQDQKIALSCDGCAAGLSGHISFIAATAEFTPPVIYTRKDRQKLTFMVEVRPDMLRAFRPGQPVDVTLP